MNAGPSKFQLYGNWNVAEAIAVGLLAGVNVVLQPALCKFTPSHSLPRHNELSEYPPVNHRQLFAPPPELRVTERIGAGVVVVVVVGAGVVVVVVVGAGVVVVVVVGPEPS